MNKTVLVIFITSGFAAPLAYAQSSVTLYGIIDNGVSYVNSSASSLTTKGARLIGAATSFGSGDRLGFTGKEDLGGGSSAIFTLESGFSGNTGALSQGGRLFGRQSFVGLSDRNDGTLTMGRQYDYTFDYVAPMTSWLQFGSIYGAHIGDVDDTFQTYRLNNSVKYQVTPIPGLQVGGLYAFSNQSGGSNGAGFANNRAWSLGARYDNGPLGFATSYLTLNSPSSGQSATNNPNGAVGDEYSLPSSIFYNEGFVNRQSIFAAATAYTISALRLNFMYSDTQLTYQGNRSLRVDNYELNGKYQMTPAFSIGLGYIFTNGSGFTGTGAQSYADGTHPKWHQIDFGVSYQLSKNTDLHLSTVYQRAAGDATEAAINVIGPAGIDKKSQMLVATGLRYRF
ncbi:porin [Glaciimonas soli]|uniref:Porin n=1 Tax=Glaciimonas soli TaxID=2590999 RepID=A0A843YK81_9BURK|nr:porin [Glaciimonas soli]MQR00209.1 porin [Glaciimonas soli]